MNTELLTIDVFASKRDHAQRVFQLREFSGNANTGQFQEREVYAEEELIKRIIGE